jgi:hypothetical protein
MPSPHRIVAMLGGLLLGWSATAPAQTLFTFDGRTTAGGFCVVQAQVADDPVAADGSHALVVRFCREGRAASIAMPASGLDRAEPSHSHPHDGTETSRETDVIVGFGRDVSQQQVNRHLPSYARIRPSDPWDPMVPIGLQRRRSLLDMLSEVRADRHVEFLALTGRFENSWASLAIQLRPRFGDRTLDQNLAAADESMLWVVITGNNIPPQTCRASTFASAAPTAPGRDGHSTPQSRLARCLAAGSEPEQGALRTTPFSFD